MDLNGGQITDNLNISLESQSSSDRFTYNAAPHTLDSNQQRFLIALAEKLISNLRMQIVHRVQTYRVVT